jgi:hypothetical protein
MAALSQPDDNMIPGQTYTFQLKLSNWITFPSTNTVQQDLTNNAPSFVSDLQITSPTFTSLYNIQFTYSGDGTDVISDVANSLIAAIKAGSNDDFTFVGAVADTAQSITVSLGTAAQKVSDTVGTAVNSATQGAAKNIADAAQKVLTPIEIAVVILVGLVVLVIFTSGKAGGVSASETGLNIGGSK